MSNISHSAARRNGVLDQIQRYLNTIGSWSTYRDLSRPEELPKRLADITTAFFGLSGLNRNGIPKVTGILGAIMAVHALEQVTGAAATFSIRLLARGEPLGQYRGVILRESPFTPRAARSLRWLIGSRLLEASGTYFFESGRTWHCQTLLVRIWDTNKTLTHVRCFSLPYREYYFDREVSLQTIVDVVKGDREPNSIPGFIGSVNELENSTSLAYLKRAFFAANWLLIDPAERDDGGSGGVDYDTLINGKPPGGGGLGSGLPYRPRPSSPLSGTGGYRRNSDDRRDNRWPSTTERAITPPIEPNRVAAVIPNGTAAFRPVRPSLEPIITTPSTGIPPAPANLQEEIQARYHASDGRQYPLLVRGITTNPITMARKVDAIYYDSETKRWHEIVADGVRIALAREVEAGHLKVTQDWQDYL